MQEKTKFTIEKNIPIGVLPDRSIYPLSKMAVGDSFFVKGDRKKVTAVSVAVSTYKRTNKDVNFTLRSNNEGARVWRIK